MEKTMLKIRCSEICHIIGTPKKAGETLTQTAKTHLLNTFKRQQFGFTRFKGTGCTEKGKLLEDTAVKASGMVRGKVYAKNTVRRENDFITGECDIHDPAARLIIDTKCSWDIGTHPFFPAEAAQKAADAGYIWQMHGYMWLYGADTAEIDFLAVSHSCRTAQSMGAGRPRHPAPIHRAGGRHPACQTPHHFADRAQPRSH